MKKYTTTDIASELGISDRTVRRWIADLIDYSKGKYIVSEDVLNLLKNRLKSEGSRTDFGQTSDTENEDDFDYYEAFTADEYIEFQKRINEYPVLKEYIESLKTELEFLRFNFAQQTETNKSLVQSLREKNFIEAKEKGLDKD